MAKPVLRKFKSIQARRPSKDGLKTSTKQYDAYVLYAPGTETALIPIRLAEFLIENNLVDFRGGEKE